MNIIHALKKKKNYDKPRQHIQTQRHHFANKDSYSQSYCLSRSHVQMWELDHKEGWVLRNWCFWTVVLEKTLENHLDSKEIKPVNSKRIDPEYSLEVLMLKLQNFDHLIGRSDLLEKTLMLGKTDGRRRGWQRMRRLDGVTDSTWVWANSGRWWRTKKPGMLPSMGLQRIGHSLATEQQQ